VDQARLAVDPDHAIAPGQPAEEGHVAELVLHHHHRGSGEAQGFDRFDHRLMLDRNQVGTFRDLPVPVKIYAEDMAHQPIVEVRPAVDSTPDRRRAEGRDDDDRQHVKQRAGVKEQEK